MTVIAIVPAIAALAGALVYAFAANPKLAEIGRLVFFAGFLVFCFMLAGHVVRIG